MSDRTWKAMAAACVVLAAAWNVVQAVAQPAGPASPPAATDAAPPVAADTPAAVAPAGPTPVTPTPASPTSANPTSATPTPVTPTSATNSPEQPVQGPAAPSQTVVPGQAASPPSATPSDGSPGVAAPNPPAPAVAALPAALPAAPAPSRPGLGIPATVIDLHEVDGVMGKSVLSAAGEDMGRIVDVIVAGNGHVRAAVIDFGGFLGVGSRKVAVDWKALQFGVDGRMGQVSLTELTRNQVRLSPEYKVGEPVVILGAPAAAATASTRATPNP